MQYHEFKVKDKIYKLRLSTRDVIALEKAIGVNPIFIFGIDEKNPVMPTETIMVNILHQSLQKYQHGITFNDALDIFDEYIDDGHMPVEFAADIVEIFKVSGLMKEDKPEVKN